MSKLVVLALLSELLTPILIWKAGLPSDARWLSSAVLVIVLMDGYAHLLRSHRVPSAFWWIVGLSVVGISRALLNGQSTSATVWGWWLMFRYPLVGLYVYLWVRSSRESRPQILKWTILLLVLEVMVQLGEYAMGQTPGDQLGGTLGESGTGALALVVLLVLALALGEWIVSGGIALVGVVIVLGIASSTLGEMKIFFFAAAAIAMISAAIHLLRRRRLGQVLPYVFVLAAALAAFPRVYDSVVPSAQERPLLGYLDAELFSRYTGFVEPSHESDYAVGRFYALTYAWEQISGSPISVAVGDGLGARGESKTLGSTGQALLTGQLGITTGGGSLSVVIGELGILGLIALSGFVLWVAGALWRGARSGTCPDIEGLQYGLLIYSIMWPVWLWYNVAWTIPVPMLLYWSALGYSLARSQQEGSRHPIVPPRPTRTKQLMLFREAKRGRSTIQRRTA